MVKPRGQPGKGLGALGGSLGWGKEPPEAAAPAWLGGSGNHPHLGILASHEL